MNYIPTPQNEGVAITAGDWGELYYVFGNTERRFKTIHIQPRKQYNHRLENALSPTGNLLPFSIGYSWSME